MKPLLTPNRSAPILPRPGALLRGAVFVAALAGAAGVQSQVAGAPASAPAASASAPTKPAKTPKATKDKAAAPKAQGSLGKGVPTGRLLTKEELQSCLAEQQALTEAEASLKQQQQTFETDKASILAEGEALKEALTTLDRADPVAVAAFNDKSAAHDRRIDELQSRVAPYNARASQTEEQHAGWDSRCGNRKFFEEDLNALNAEAAKAGK